jgi:hypothetical protein
MKPSFAVPWAMLLVVLLYGKSPAGNAYDYYGKVDKDTAAFLRRVAAETVRTFFGR